MWVKDVKGAYVNLDRCDTMEIIFSEGNGSDKWNVVISGENHNAVLHSSEAFTDEKGRDEAYAKCAKHLEDFVNIMNATSMGLLNFKGAGKK